MHPNHTEAATRGARPGTASIALAVLAACLVFGVMQGVRDNYGIMLNGLVAQSGVQYGYASFVIAVGQILYGATQPLFGMAALRRSNAFVMLCGAVLMAAGLIVTPLCTAEWSLMLFFGVVLPAGTGALCFGIVMGRWRRSSGKSAPPWFPASCRPAPGSGTRSCRRSFSA